MGCHGLRTWNNAALLAVNGEDMRTPTPFRALVPPVRNLAKREVRQVLAVGTGPPAAPLIRVAATGAATAGQQSQDAALLTENGVLK